MQVCVWFYGSLREAFGTHSTVVEIVDGATLAELGARLLGKREPGLMPGISYVVNWNPARPDTTLKPGDEVALLPFA